MPKGIPESNDLRRLFDPFPPEDLEWRIVTARRNADGGRINALVVPYVSARAVAERCDAVAGPGNWRNEPYMAGPLGGMMAGLSFRVVVQELPDGTVEWECVTKWDGADNPGAKRQGDDDGAEMVIKGGFSNADKRAAVKWGIGRDLYYLPRMYAEVLPDGQYGQYYASNVKVGKSPQDRASFAWNPPDLARNARSKWYVELVRDAKARATVERPEPAPEDLHDAEPHDAPGDGVPGDTDHDAEQAKEVTRLRNVLHGYVESAFMHMDYDSMPESIKVKYKAMVDLIDNADATQKVLEKAVEWATPIVNRWRERQKEKEAAAPSCEPGEDDEDGEDRADSRGSDMDPDALRAHIFGMVKKLGWSDDKRKAEMKKSGLFTLAKGADPVKMRAFANLLDALYDQLESAGQLPAPAPAAKKAQTRTRTRR